MKQLVIYIHGKGGSAEEAEHYKPLFSDSDVIGFDYRAQTPWAAKEEFPAFFDAHAKGYASVILIANSIGAYFALSALADRRIDQALLISPIVDMERLIEDMMLWAEVSPADLEKRGEIPTEFGETLSWEYLCYARRNPIAWRIPSCVLYGKRDSMTSPETIARFCVESNASLCVMPDGEHWFHTDAQMEFLDTWIRKNRKSAT